MRWVRMEITASLRSPVHPHGSLLPADPIIYQKKGRAPARLFLKPPRPKPDQVGLLGIKHAFETQISRKTRATPSSSTRLILVRKYVAGQCVYVARFFFSRGRGRARSGGRRRASLSDRISS